MRKAYILSGVRTSIGKYLGALVNLTAPQLVAFASVEALKIVER